MKTLQLVETTKTQKQLYIEQVKQTCDRASLLELDPTLNALGRERLSRTLDILKKITLQDQKIIDLGCGTGYFAEALIQKGASVTCVDASARYENVIEAAIPYMPFEEKSFDGAIFTDVIAEIEPALHRLTFSEIAALLVADGWLISSTQLDTETYDSAESFLELIKTEFDILYIVPSYHRLPLPKSLKQNKKLLLIFESLSRLFLGRKALTHLIVLARKKKINYNC